MAISRVSIASSLADAFRGVTPPSGETLRGSLWEPPDQVAATPFVLVVLTEEELTYPASARHSLTEWSVQFLIDQVADQKRQVARVLRWMDVIVPQLDAYVHLGLGGSVNVADIVGVRPALLRYAEVDYDGFEAVVRVNAQEGVTYSG